MDHDEAVVGVDARTVDDRTFARIRSEDDVAVRRATTRRHDSLVIDAIPEVDDVAGLQHFGRVLDRRPRRVDGSSICVVAVRCDVVGHTVQPRPVG
jgi:hypothetical protein